MTVLVPDPRATDLRGASFKQIEVLIFKLYKQGSWAEGYEWFKTQALPELEAVESSCCHYLLIKEELKLTKKHLLNQQSILESKQCCCPTETRPICQFFLYSV